MICNATVIRKNKKVNTMIYVGIINVLALSKLRFRSDKMIKAVIERINYAVIMINV